MKMLSTKKLFQHILWAASLGISSMSSSFAQLNEVKIFAHRAGAHEYDENTLSAFKTTYEQGMRGYETDVRITKDGHLVIFHDDNLKRIVGREGVIEEMTLAEIKKLKTLKGNEIPTLDEIVDYFKDKPGVYIEFEMKTSKPMYDEVTLHKYCDMLYNKVYSNRPQNSDYLLTSFDKRPLQYLKQKYPNADLMFIKGEALTQALIDETKALGIKRIAANITQTTRAMVKDAKKQGMTVSLWPGRSVDDFLLGLSLGSDYLCTDVPIEVSTWVKNNASWIKLK